MKIILSGGGTGGHIFPAIAIADKLKLKYPNIQIFFVGAKGKMEMEKIPKIGYKIEGLWISGLQRSLSFKNILFPLKVIISLIKSFFILKKEKPNLVIGTGGFASGPLLFMASLMKIKTIIQEQNSYPGITNRILKNRVSKILIAYQEAYNYFPKNKVVFTGNPMREELSIDQDKNLGISYFSLDKTKKTILVLGGSLGAKNINNIVFKNIDNILKNNDIQILWQCGKLYYEYFSQKINNNNIKLLPFLDNMGLAYKVSDLVISRAGAITLTELTNLGKASIIIPSPNVAENHQEKNAKVLERKNACILIKENELEMKFLNTLYNLIYDDMKLVDISKNAKNISKPKALQNIIEEIEKELLLL